MESVVVGYLFLGHGDFRAREQNKYISPSIAVRILEDYI